MSSVLASAAGRRRGIMGLAAVLAVLWAVQFRPFVFPNNDFYSYRRAAWSLQQGELPPSTKRGPILPAAIAALAPAIPGEQPEVTAALAVNLACSVGLFVALAIFAAHVFPGAALLFAVLLATTPVLHAAALQPLLEPSLGLFVALAFLALAARSPWQYAAAGAAALSRPDAIVLVAILAAANAVAERRFVRHAALAAAAAVPCVAWYSLGRSDGASTYLALREAYGAGAPAYLAILPKEIFTGWWRQGPIGPALLAVAALVPAAWGARVAWRRAPRETAAMLAWFAASCAIVVLYGVGKTRYVHPIAWVPLLCLAVGVVDLVPRAAAVLYERSAGTARAAILLLAIGSVAAGARAVAGLTAPASPLAVAPDFLFALVAMVFLAVLFQASSAPAAQAAALLAVALTAPVALGGVARKRELVAAVHDFDRAAAAAAEWVRRELPPGDRIAALHFSQIEFASGLPSERIVAFRHLTAETPEELRAELARENVRWVVYTWRRPPETKAERFYAERRREALAEPFAAGAPVPGFVHVAELPAEPRLGQPPAQIYRRED